MNGTLPPPSQYPRLDRGELASPTQAALGFPTIPGVPLPDGVSPSNKDEDFTVATIVSPSAMKAEEEEEAAEGEVPTVGEEGEEGAEGEGGEAAEGASEE